MSKKQERQTKEVEKCKQAIDRETEIERQRDSDREKRSAVPQKRHVKTSKSQDDISARDLKQTSCHL